MKVQPEQNQRQELFTPLPIQDDIEPARAEMRKYTNNPRSITTEHLQARHMLLDILLEKLAKQDDDARSKLNSITRIESVLSELDQEMDQNKSLAIDSHSHLLAKEIRSWHTQLPVKLKAAKQKPDILALVAEQEKAEAQQALNAQLKAGRLGALKRNIGDEFKEENPAHQQAIDFIYDFNQLNSARFVLSEEMEVRAIFTLLANHPEVMVGRDPNSVIESARAGYKIVHNALTTQGTLVSMGDWAAEEPKIMSKLLPKLSLLDTDALSISAQKITAEYAQSIWDNRTTSVSALFGGAARSITEERLSLVASQTLDAQLGQSVAVEPPQAGVVKGVYEAAASLFGRTPKAQPKPAPMMPSSSSSSPPKSASDIYSEMAGVAPEDALASPTFSSVIEGASAAFNVARDKSIELDAMAQSSCFKINTRIAHARSMEELEVLRQELARIQESAASANDQVGAAATHINGSLDAVRELLQNVPNEPMDAELAAAVLLEPRETQKAAEAARVIVDLVATLDELQLHQKAKRNLGIINSTLAEAHEILTQRKKAIPIEQGLAADMAAIQSQKHQAQAAATAKPLQDIPEVMNFDDFMANPKTPSASPAARPRSADRSDQASRVEAQIAKTREVAAVHDARVRQAAMDEAREQWKDNAQAKAIDTGLGAVKGIAHGITWGLVTAAGEGGRLVGAGAAMAKKKWVNAEKRAAKPEEEKTIAEKAESAVFHRVKQGAGLVATGASKVVKGVGEAGAQVLTSEPAQQAFVMAADASAQAAVLAAKGAMNAVSALPEGTLEKAAALGKKVAGVAADVADSRATHEVLSAAGKGATDGAKNAFNAQAQKKTVFGRLFGGRT